MKIYKWLERDASRAREAVMGETLREIIAISDCPASVDIACAALSPPEAVALGRVVAMHKDDDGRLIVEVHVPDGYRASATDTCVIIARGDSLSGGDSGGEHAAADGGGRDE